VSSGLVFIVPVSVSAQESTGAMLRGNGVGVFVNDKSAPTATALFGDDVIRTEKNAAARIESTGSSADIGPETIVQFEGDELALDHGSVSVNTTRGIKVRVGCLTITPVDDANWTQYDVVDRDGKVTVSALKLDVYIDAHTKKTQQPKPGESKSRDRVREGEQKTREDKCGGGYLNPSDIPAGEGAILSSPWAVASGAGAIIALTCWALCQGSNPVSPTKP
jgi:hypothetical protein